MAENSNGKKIISGMIWRFGEKITAQLVSFIVSIVLARILMPDDYGVVAIVTIFIAIAEIFVTSGLGTSLIQKKDATKRDFSTIFWCNIVMSVVLYGIVFVIAPIIAGFYKMPVLTPVVRVFALRLPISAINSIQNAYVSRNMDFKKFFFATIIGTIISAVVGIVMALKGFGVWALVGQYLTNSTIDTFVLFITIKWRPTLEFSFKEAKPLVSYGWKILATDLLGTIFNQLNSFVIGKRYSSSDLAYYTQGKRIPDLINTNVGATLTAVLFPAMSLTDDKEQIKQIRRKSLKMLEYVMFPLMIGMFAVADKMILVLFTDKWLFAVPYVRIACIDAIIAVFGTTLIQELKAIGRSDVTLRLELVKKPLFLITIFIAMQFNVLAVALTLIVNEIIAFLFNVYPVRKYIGFDFKVHFLDAVPSFLMSLAMAIVVYVIGYLITNDIICLLVQMITGVIVYILLSIMLKNDNFLYIIKMVKSRRK